MNRKHFPPDIETQVFLKCRRRCTLCYILDNDLRWKKGQLAHIDRDRTNVAPENAAYLCAAHHDEYDSKPSQTKGFTPDELKAYQAILYQVIESPDWLRIGGGTIHVRRNRKPPRGSASLEVYDRRLPIYQKTVQFVRDVANDLRPELRVILQFATDTEQALFLFDETVAAFLAEMFKKALRLHTVSLLRERMVREGEMENFHALVQEQTNLAVWFTSQYDVIRRYFAPFLRLAS